MISNYWVSDANGKVIYLLLSYSCVIQGNEQAGGIQVVCIKALCLCVPAA